jgi:acyl-coenzyme A thioesterase PaaI-like protein
VQQLLEQGWSEITDEGFIGLVGPFYQKKVGDEYLFCFPTGAKHRNRRGVVQGGALMTFADRCMGIVGRHTAGVDYSATVQMDVQFIGATTVGDTVELRAQVVKTTSRLIFMRAEITSGGEVVVAINGIWKKLGATAAVAPIQAL